MPLAIGLWDVEDHSRIKVHIYVYPCITHLPIRIHIYRQENYYHLKNVIYSDL